MAVKVSPRGRSVMVAALSSAFVSRNCDLEVRPSAAPARRRRQN